MVLARALQAFRAALTCVPARAVLLALVVTRAAALLSGSDIADTVADIAGPTAIAAALLTALVIRARGRGVPPFQPAATAPPEPPISRRIESVQSIMETALAPYLRHGLLREVRAVAVVDGRADLWPEGALDDARSYEIGSITKTMTGELLARGLVDGQRALDDRLGSVLHGLDDSTPAGAITLLDLATHSSGLPRVPTTPRLLAGHLLLDPYRWVDDATLLASLRRTGLRPGSRYSNLGFAVLGLALAGTTESFHDRLACWLRDLGVDQPDTGAGRAPAPHRGHDALGLPARSWRSGAVAPAGGVRMSIAQGMTWLRAHVDPPAACRQTIMAATEPRRPFGTGAVGLGWQMSRPDPHMKWHNGETGGFSSFAAFRQDRGLGVLVLAATANGAATTRAGATLARALRT